MKKIEVRYNEPGGIIWKVLPDEEGKNLVIESRDAERRRTLFAVLSIANNTFSVKEIPTPKPWWIGLKIVGFGKAVFQGYKESQTPEPQGVYIMDLLTGNLDWKEEDKIVHSLSDRTSIVLSAREEDQIVYHKMDLSSGKLLEKIHEEISIGGFPETSSVFPLLYSEENIHYKTISEFILQNGYKNVGPIEYLEYAGKILVSFYIQEGKKLINILLITDEDGNLLLNDRLTEGAEGIGMSSFFICAQKLIYIKNKTSIALAEIE